MSTEQRTNLKFLVRLEETPTEALGLLQQVYGNEAMSRCRVFEWHKRFQEGRENVEDNPRSGRPSTSKAEELGMRKICAKMVPRLLTDEQKERRVQVCQD